MGTFAEMEPIEAQLESADYRGIRGVLTAVGQARTSAEFHRLALEAVDAILLALRPHLAFGLRTILLNDASPPNGARLSPRETEVGSMVALGCSNREIARHLGIGEDTVKKHLLHAMDKLDVRNRTQLALLLRKQVDSTFVQ